MNPIDLCDVAILDLRQLFLSHDEIHIKIEFQFAGHVHTEFGCRKCCPESVLKQIG